MHPHKTNSTQERDLKRRLSWIAALVLGMPLVATACQPSKAASPPPSSTTSLPPSTTAAGSGSGRTRHSKYNETAQILGTPAVAGTYSSTAQLFGATANAQSIILTITINPQPSITTVSLPFGQVGTSYTHIVTSTGGSTPYTWAVSDAALPDSLTLDDSTSAIMGTPTNAGTFNFTVALTDAAGAVVSQTLFIQIGPAGSGN